MCVEGGGNITMQQKQCDRYLIYHVHIAHSNLFAKHCIIFTGFHLILTKFHIMDEVVPFSFRNVRPWTRFPWLTSLNLLHFIFISQSPFLSSCITVLINSDLSVSDLITSQPSQSPNLLMTSQHYSGLQREYKITICITLSSL